MSNEPVIIFGATSGGGLELAKRIRSDDRLVCAVVRPTTETDLLVTLGVELRVADAFDATAVDQALKDFGQGATVASFLGGGFAEGRPIDGIGNINAIDAATRAGAGRFILMTSIGCGDSYDAAPELSKQMWTELWKEKNRGEKHLKNSPIGWTIIRPGGLRASKPTGNGILVEDPLTFGLIHRKDLGAVTYAAVNSTAVIGKTYTAVDQTQAEHARDGQIIPAAI